MAETFMFHSNISRKRFNSSTYEHFFLGEVSSDVSDYLIYFSCLFIIDSTIFQYRPFGNFKRVNM